MSRVSISIAPGKMKGTGLIFGIALVVLVLVSGCSLGEAPQCGENDKVWATRLELWRSKNISNYDMVIQRSKDPTYGHVPFMIKVRDGKNISLEPARENLGLELTDGYEPVKTVEQMFDLIQEACGRSANVRAEYDENLGIPSFIAFNSQVRGEQGIHNRESFKLLSFVSIDSSSR